MPVLTALSDPRKRTNAIFALVLLVLLILAGCGTAPSETTADTPADTSTQASAVTDDGGGGGGGAGGGTGGGAGASFPPNCNGNMIADYEPDNSDSAIVRKGVGANPDGINPDGAKKLFIDVTTAYRLLQKEASTEASDGLAKLMPWTATQNPVRGIICPSGEVFINGRPNPVMIKVEIVNRDDVGATARFVSNKQRGMFFWRHPASILTKPCPALVTDLNGIWIRAVCMNNLNPVLPPDG